MRGARRCSPPTRLASSSATCARRASRPRPGAAWPGCGSRREDGWIDRLRAVIELCRGARTAVVCLSPADLRGALGDQRLGVAGVLLRAELPRQRPLAALAARELLAAGLRTRIVTKPAGRVASRRALAGIDPGGDVSRRAGRLARGLLAAQAGQALPLVLGGLLALVLCTLILAAFGGAVTGTSRVQRAADLAALSAARSMRDDFERLFEPARSPDGSLNPAHLAKAAYLDRASAAAVDAARRNGVDAGRLRVEFPDLGSFAPLRVRAQVTAELETAGALPDLPVDAEAEAEASPPSAAATGAAPEVASGGGYSGPLVYRQGEGMRPDVAAAFDRMAAAASSAGVALLVNSGYRSDAEQAALWAQHPDPRWVAPPGTSLHRCATELDLGPPAAYGWLAANAHRFGFLQRYAWESWHYGFVQGPAPCSAAGDEVGSATNGGADGGAAATSLPAYVPARFRDAARGRRPALERLRRPAGRAADGGVELQPLRHLAGRCRRDRPVHAGNRGRVRARRPVRCRGRHRRPGAPDGGPPAAVRLGGARPRRLQRGPGAGGRLRVRPCDSGDPGIRGADRRADGRGGGDRRGADPGGAAGGLRSPEMSASRGHLVGAPAYPG